jgi:hypothetical protein
LVIVSVLASLDVITTSLPTPVPASILISSIQPLVYLPSFVESVSVVEVPAVALPSLVSV